MQMSDIYYFFSSQFINIVKDSNHGFEKDFFSMHICM